MERRKFIGSAGLAGILAAGLPPAVQAAQATRWRLASRLPKTMDIPHAGIQTFIRVIKELSGGKFEILLQPFEELAPGQGVLESVQKGSVECGLTSASYYVGKDETFALDHALPFGMNARQTDAWLRHGQGLELLREFYRGHGVVNFPMGNTGAQMGGWYFRQPRSLHDLKGLKMRIGGLAARVFERLGGKPVTLSSGETFTALKQGEISAAEWGCPHDDLKLGLHDRCRYYAFPGWWKGSSQFSLYVNRRAYDSLSDENQANLEAAAASTHLDIQAQYDMKNPLALAELTATGTQLVPMPAPVMDAAWKQAQDLFAELAARNVHWKKIHASYAGFQKHQGWQQAEVGYDGYLHAQLMKQAEAARRAQKLTPGKRR